MLKNLDISANEIFEISQDKFRNLKKLEERDISLLKTRKECLLKIN